MTHRSRPLSPWSLSLALLGLAGAACSSDERPADPLAGSTPGAPTTGARPEPSGPSDAQVHEAQVKAAIARVGLALPGELAAWKAASLVEARVTLGADAFTARWRYAGLNQGATTLEHLAFEVPVNRDTPSAPVVLEAVTVAGRPVTAAGTTRRWEIPIAAAPGARFEVELTIRGALPPARSDRDRAPAPSGAVPKDPGLAALLDDLTGMPALSNLVPVIALEEAAAAHGAHDQAWVVAGALPRRIVAPGQQASRTIVELEVTAERELEVDATGRRLASEPDGQRLRHRFAAAGGDDVAIVATRGLSATSTVAADVPVTVREPAPSSGTSPLAPELLRTARRTLEDLQRDWGPRGPSELAIIAIDGLDGVVALPGIALVPAGVVRAPEPPATGQGLVPSLSLDGVFQGLVESHPAAKEALAFALATAIAQDWWRDHGADAPADLLLRHGLTRAGALTVVAGKGGDKASRRARTLGLELPAQLALQRGEPDPVLARVTHAGSPLAQAKAGLFASTLTRHLGDTQMAALVARLATTPVLDLPTLRREILAVAPRPDETDRLLARWLDEAHLDEDVGPLRPDVLLEYLVADGAIAGLSQRLMDQLGPDRLGGRALELLEQGQALDAGLALSLLGELAAQDADPATKKWLSLGSRLFGGPDERKRAVEGLVDDLATELGLPESERSRLKQLSNLLSTMLGDDLEPAPSPSPAPQPTPAP